MATPGICTAVADVLRPYRWVLAASSGALFAMTAIALKLSSSAAIYAGALSIAIFDWGLVCVTFWFNSQSGTVTRPSESVRHWISEKVSNTPQNRWFAALVLDLWFLFALMFMLKVVRIWVHKHP